MTISARRSSSERRGFTIIEVVLVLAVAGLIMAMVFIALPAMQRAQKDKQRKSDINRFLAAVTDYQTNNSGLTPWSEMAGDGWDNTNNENFITNYIDSEATFDGSGQTLTCSQAFMDPDGSCYQITTWDSIDHQLGRDTIGETRSVTEGWYHGAHIIRAGVGWHCGEMEDEVVFDGKPNRVMLVYITSSDDSYHGGDSSGDSSIICVDNR